jgi:hypothetical protein
MIMITRIEANYTNEFLESMSRRGAKAQSLASDGTDPKDTFYHAITAVWCLTDRVTKNFNSVVCCRS